MQCDDRLLIYSHLDKDDLATWRGLPVRLVQDHMHKRARREAAKSEAWTSWHRTVFLSFHLILSPRAQRAGLWMLLTVWPVGLAPPSGALGGSTESALAAWAPSVISLDSWERARCQKCLQVNTWSLSSASDLPWWLKSVFILCWEGLSVRLVNLFPGINYKSQTRVEGYHQVISCLSGLISS